MEHSETMDEIHRGFARALFVNGMLGAIGELLGEPNDPDVACYCCSAEGVGKTGRHYEDCEAASRARELDHASLEDLETSEHAERTAHIALRCIARENACELDTVYEVNAAREGHEREPTPYDFGWYLAMQWLGTGSCWSDSHPDHDLDTGSGEYVIHDILDPEDASPTPAVEVLQHLTLTASTELGTITRQLEHWLARHDEERENEGTDVLSSEVASAIAALKQAAQCLANVAPQE